MLAGHGEKPPIRREGGQFLEGSRPRSRTTQKRRFRSGGRLKDGGGGLVAPEGQQRPQERVLISSGGEEEPRVVALIFDKAADRERRLEGFGIGQIRPGADLRADRRTHPDRHLLGRRIDRRRGFCALHQCEELTQGRDGDHVPEGGIGRLAALRQTQRYRLEEPRGPSRQNGSLTRSLSGMIDAARLA